MRIDVYSRPEHLQLLRDSWDRIYGRDPEAHFFLSWTWLSKYVRIYDPAWFILAARPKRDAPHVALMPLRLRTRMKSTGHFYNEINMGGNYGADYTGLLCEPEFAGEAIPAFARYLRKMNWTRVHLENMRMSNERLQSFLGQFSGHEFALSEISRVNKADNVDNRKCLSIALPGSWDGYLETVGTNTRQKIRRFLRKVEGTEEFRITHADGSTIERDIDILLGFWKEKWGARKGKRLPVIVRHSRRILRDSFESGSLFLPILWQGERPTGALAIFVDEAKRAMLFFMAGRDESVSSLPVGLVLHGYCIRKAIADGFRTYDFLRGDEPYKYAFGTRESTIYCGQLSTRSGKNVGDRIDPRSVKNVFHQATRLHKEGRLIEAQTAYMQILKVDPANGRTLYVVGQLLTQKKKHDEAAAIFRRLTRNARVSAKVWLRLGYALKNSRQFEEAAAAFRKAEALRPGLTIARFGLAQCLLELWQFDEAAEVFAAILRQPVSSYDRVLRRKSWILLQKLKNREPGDRGPMLLTDQHLAVGLPVLSLPSI